MWLILIGEPKVPKELYLCFSLNEIYGCKGKRNNMPVIKKDFKGKQYNISHIVGVMQRRIIMH